MQKAQDHRYDLLLSSSELGWSNLFAEVRSYGRGEGVHPAEPETKITILLDRSEGTTGWRMGGSWQTSQHIPGLFWVKPKGGKYDEAYIITGKKLRYLNLHLNMNMNFLQKPGFKFTCKFRFKWGKSDSLQAAQHRCLIAILRRRRIRRTRIGRRNGCHTSG